MERTSKKAPSQFTPFLAGLVWGALSWCVLFPQKPRCSSNNCIKFLQEEAVYFGYANWINFDDGSRGFKWVEPKGQN